MIVEVSARTFAVPFECPCCGAVPDAELAIPLTRTGRRVQRDTKRSIDERSESRGWGPTGSARGAGVSPRSIDVPYCQRCVEHVELWSSAGVRSAAVIVAGLVAAVIVAIATRLVIGAIAFLAAAAFAWSLATARRAAAHAGCSPGCAAPEAALAYLGWSGTASALSFESPTYAARFAEENAAHLVQMNDRLRKLLDGYRIARLAVPTPAVPLRVVRRLRAPQ